VGIAYALNSKTVIRAGAGRYTTRLGVSDSVFLGGNPPFQPTPVFPMARQITLVVAARPTFLWW